MARHPVGRAYDARAEEYTERLGDVAQLAVPDRELIGRWRDSTPGTLLDAGCGPGHWTGFLREHPAVRPLGIDLSERFLDLARARHPGVPFALGSIEALPLRSGSVDGVLAWYSLIHTPPASVPAVLSELRRVLNPGGSLLLGFFDGADAEPFPHLVTTAYFWSVPALRRLLGAAGFDVVEHHLRHDEGHRPHGAIVAVAP